MANFRCYYCDENRCSCDPEDGVLNDWGTSDYLGPAVVSQNGPVYTAVWNTISAEPIDCDEDGNYGVPIGDDYDEERGRRDALREFQEDPDGVYFEEIDCSDDEDERPKEVQ
jgi:hypothetical protein